MKYLCGRSSCVIGGICRGAAALALLAVALLLPFSSRQPAAPDPQSAHKLFEGARLNDLDAIHRALSQGTDVNAVQDGSEITALMWAARLGHVDAARLLIDRGASIHLMAGAQSTALGEAAAKGQRQVAEMLLERGADPNAVMHRHHTPLMLAANGSDPTLVELLLSAGARVNARGMSGSTPLIEAAAGGDALILNILLNAGARLEDRNNQGMDARAVARWLSNDAAVQVLKEARQAPMPE